MKYKNVLEQLTEGQEADCKGCGAKCLVCVEMEHFQLCDHHRLCFLVYRLKQKKNKTLNMTAQGGM